MVYNILEVANTHGGNINYVYSLIDEFQEFNGYGMKFQPLHPDQLSTVDYEGYPIYKELLFTPEQWHEILSKASSTKEIWLDLFDLYGVQIFVENTSLVKGVKLQSSVLFNEVLIDKLSETKLHNKILIINISGYEISKIKERLDSLKRKLEPTEIWIEVGFQAYPTSLIDSGYAKIQSVKTEFSSPVVFADHVDANGEDAVWLPVLAAMNGANVIEKHIKHSTLDTKYDHYSSIDINKYRKYNTILNDYLNLKNQPFINQKEMEYLAKSIQIPICKSNLKSGQLINMTKDLDFKRSGKSGLNAIQIKALMDNFHILANDKVAGDTFKQEDFKKATIATIIACRLKSSRLPKKALLFIGDLTSVERCIKSCLAFPMVNHTILATSTLPEDNELANYTYNSNVIFHRGDPDDVIQRYLDIVEKLKIDVIYRVTADCPYSSPEIAEYLLREHFKSGADYTATTGAAIGTDAEIINTSALRKIKTYFKKADYSEYMTWYFQNNPEHFKIEIVSLPESWCRDYRLTLDYQKDLDLFNEVHSELSTDNPEYGYKDVIKLLDNTELSEINKGLTLKYVVDKELIDKLNQVTKIKISV